MTKTISLSKDTKIKLINEIKDIQKINPEDLMNYINELVDEYTYLSLNEKKSLDEIKVRLKNNIEGIKEKLSLVIYATHNNKIIGKINARRHHGNYNHIMDFEMSVSKEFRGKGLGKILLKECLKKIKKDFKDIKIIEASIYENNEIALKMYDKFDFIEIARIPKAYQWKPPGKKLEYKDRVIMHYYL